MSVELVGYSERGMMNALCYDILGDPTLERLGEFLSWFDFSHAVEEPRFVDIESARLIVEQSYSDFGDLDLLILLNHKPPHGDGRPPAKQAVLIEAKVSTDTNSWQTIEDRFGEFLRIVDGGEGSTSNLFVQLHRKVRLVDFLTNGVVPFDPDIFTPRGSLGTNQVVQRARQALESYVAAGARAWYGAIVPDDPAALETFVRDNLPIKNINNKISRWDASHWGFLSWHTIKAEVGAQAGRWPITRATFEWNKGQIFRDAPPIGPVVQAGGIYKRLRRHVFVVSAPTGPNCRVALLEEGDPAFFWKSDLVPVGELQAVVEPLPPYRVPVRPTVGQSYAWVDRRDDLPPTDEPHPPGMADETSLTVIGPSWLTTRVRNTTDPPRSRGFLVYTHYLQRVPIA